MQTFTLLNKDCYEAIKDMKDNSIDAIITDPPYDINFMGKGWDKNSLITNVDFWKECLRVLKHGGHLLAFGHSRTSHRMVSAVEEAGFDIRDTIMWIYGSGFPKSHNVGKAVDKKLGNERKTIGDNPNHRESDALFELGFQGGKGDGKLTKGNSEWEGWGSALKPAHEPIVLARKPLEGTMADNVLKHGVGALNIDATRVAGKLEGNPNRFAKTNGGSFAAFPNNAPVVRSEGRWGANVILDEEAAKVLDEQSGIRTSGKMLSTHKRHTSGSANGIYGKFDEEHPLAETYGDSGGASRFFYCAKDLSDESTHEPIVLARKPLEGTMVDNVLKHGVGALNIDATRIGHNEDFSDIKGRSVIINSGCPEGHSEESESFLKAKEKLQNLGRWAANVIFNHHPDCEQVGETEETIVGGNKGTSGFAEGYESGDFTKKQMKVPVWKCHADCVVGELDKQSGVVKTGVWNETDGARHFSNDGKPTNHKTKKKPKEAPSGASKFFYCPKVGKKERNAGLDELPDKNGGCFVGNNVETQASGNKIGANPSKPVAPTKNNHPTVKPIALMEYLIKLVTREGATVLDPFMGSGSTGIAAKNLARNFVGCEREKEYFDIAEARIEGWK